MQFLFWKVFFSAKEILNVIGRECQRFDENIDWSLLITYRFKKKKLNASFEH